MTRAHRAEIVRGLCEVTRLRRRGVLSLEEDDWQAPDGTGVIVLWDDVAQAYGATWTCGRVAAGDVARIADGRGD